MGQFRGRYMLPSRFTFRFILPAIVGQPRYWGMLPQQLRRYFAPDRPDADLHVSQVAFRCTEVCNLRCASCGQWGENGWLLEKQRRGEKLDQIS